MKLGHLSYGISYILGFLSFFNILAQFSLELLMFLNFLEAAYL